MPGPEQRAVAIEGLPPHDDLGEAVAVEVGEGGPAPADGFDRSALPLERSVVLERNEVVAGEGDGDDLGPSVTVDVPDGQRAEGLRPDGRRR